jgi:hypothetical protein
MSNHFTSKGRSYSTLLGGLAALLLAGTAVAGPPLICHPFVTAEGAQLLPWVPSRNWYSPDRHYRVENLTADTLRLLTPEAPLLSRMENLRRATLYASADSQVGTELLLALLARAETPATDARAAALAQFDVGYLVETYRQLDQAVRYGMLDGKGRDDLLAVFAASATAADVAKVVDLDGRTLVRRVQEQVPALAAELELAAALMSPDNATAAVHRARAAAAAPAASAIAQNLAVYE